MTVFTAIVMSPILAPIAVTERETPIMHAERRNRSELTRKNFPNPPPLMICLKSGVKGTLREYDATMPMARKSPVQFAARVPNATPANPALNT
jgi:hypothetical protein